MKDNIFCMLFRNITWILLGVFVYSAFFQDDIDKYRIIADAYNVKVEHTTEEVKTTSGKTYNRQVIVANYSYVDRNGFVVNKSDKYYPGGGIAYRGQLDILENKHKVAEYRFFGCCWSWLALVFLSAIINIAVDSVKDPKKTTPYSMAYWLDKKSNGYIVKRIKKFFGIV